MGSEGGDVLRFRKKPVEVEAWRNDADDNTMPEWAKAAVLIRNDGSFLVNTIEGGLVARPGDWLIRGVQGEVYPCKPDIFEATYEPAGESNDRRTDQAD